MVSIQKQVKHPETGLVVTLQSVSTSASKDKFKNMKVPLSKPLTQRNLKEYSSVVYQNKVCRYNSHTLSHNIHNYIYFQNHW